MAGKTYDAAALLQDNLVRDPCQHAEGSKSSMRKNARSPSMKINPQSCPTNGPRRFMFVSGRVEANSQAMDPR